MMRVAVTIKLSAEQRQQLEKQARARSVSVRLAQRSKMILLAASGLSDVKIGAELGVKRQTVARWRSRFNRLGLTGIEKDAPRPGRKPQISAKRVKQIVRMTTQEKPSDATHWSTRSMAQAAGISEASVRRIWKKHGLKPHLLRSFKLSNDPLFAEKVADIVAIAVFKVNIERYPASANVYDSLAEAYERVNAKLKETQATQEGLT